MTSDRKDIPFSTLAFTIGKDRKIYHADTGVDFDYEARLEAAGRVYVVAGERIEPCHLFSFDPKGSGFRDLGVLAVDRSPYYSWRGCQFDAMATGPDGTVYIGESERRSHLFLYMP